MDFLMFPANQESDLTTHETVDSVMASGVSGWHKLGNCGREILQARNIYDRFDFPHLKMEEVTTAAGEKALERSVNTQVGSLY